MNTPKYCTLDEHPFTETTEFKADAGRRFVGNIGGDGDLQYWDGVQWVTYEYEYKTGFVFFVPATGDLQILVNSGTVEFSMTYAREAD